VGVDGWSSDLNVSKKLKKMRYVEESPRNAVEVVNFRSRQRVGQQSLLGTVGDGSVENPLTSSTVV
jgi:hypothetical protein